MVDKQTGVPVAEQTRQSGTFEGIAKRVFKYTIGAAAGLTMAYMALHIPDYALTAKYIDEGLGPLNPFRMTAKVTEMGKSAVSKLIGIKQPEP